MTSRINTGDGKTESESVPPSQNDKTGRTNVTADVVGEGEVEVSDPSARRLGDLGAHSGSKEGTRESADSRSRRGSQMQIDEHEERENEDSGSDDEDELKE